MTSHAFPRRRVLGGAVAAAAMTALGARTAGAAPLVKRRVSADYGPLLPTKDRATGLELLALPRGFRYTSFGWTGDTMDDGVATPAAHDGMGAFTSGSTVTIVRNHERGGFSRGFADPAYNPMAEGGTTTMTFDLDEGEFTGVTSSLSGTIRNCAGGVTPWGSWLTCEETTVIAPDGTRHGYVFEVPAVGRATGTPLRAMGRFSHEATCTDPGTGITYLTEDATPSGLYRFLPAVPGDLAAGGRLQMMRIGSGGSYQTYADGTGVEYQTSWVDIDNPDWGPGEASTVAQGQAKGAAVFRRLEGAWFDDGTAYIVSTSGGPTGQGQVFAYEPAAERMRVLFASPDATTLNNPDNICVSPRGGILLCEDGSGEEFLHGLTTDGEIFPFAKNTVVIPSGGVKGKTVRAGDYRDSEWCGSVFEPTEGKWLFANLQSPGITFAITGPWKIGSL